jgi:alpha(1,3/1,4) fucosyltransferase
VGKPFTIGFADMWQGHWPESCYFYHVLRQHFPLEISLTPDYLIYSVFGNSHAHRRFDRCVKIFYTGENVRPNMDECDFALSFDYLEHRNHIRFPLYVSYCANSNMIKPATFPPADWAGRKFCNFIYSNPNPRERIEFFELLSKYKPVDSGGGVLNNMGRRVSDKQAFIANYKFTIAFESASWPGYTTEKLVQPMMANSIPIYWGNPRVDEDFDTSSFLVATSRDSFPRIVETVARLDQDDDAYLNLLKRPWFHGNVPNQYLEPSYLLPFFERVFATKPHSESYRPKTRCRAFCWAPNKPGKART